MFSTDVSVNTASAIISFSSLIQYIWRFCPSHIKIFFKLSLHLFYGHPTSPEPLGLAGNAAVLRSIFEVWSRQFIFLSSVLPMLHICNLLHQLIVLISCCTGKPAASLKNLIMPVALFLLSVLFHCCILTDMQKQWSSNYFIKFKLYNLCSCKGQLLFYSATHILVCWLFFIIYFEIHFSCSELCLECDVLSWYWNS